jgi:hypothetical protein
MERELWPVLYRVVRQVGREVHQQGVTYQPWVIALVILWAALHDRPRNWACEATNWPATHLRPIQLPSPSVVSRRADSVGMGIFWRTLEKALHGSDCHGILSIVDGKPLFVGGCSKDPDARWGYGAGMHGKGYKLHVIWSNHAVPEAWDVTALDRSEQIVAQELLPQAAEGGYLLADGNYDTGPVHEAAGRRGYQLIAQDRRPNAGKGHHRLSLFRARGIVLRNSLFGREWLAHRSEIERIFGQSSSFAGGLSPLPAWVRRMKRVRTWVWSKLLINATRIHVKYGLAI